MSKRTIALVGGSGRLGTLIGSALLDKPDVTLRLLVRPGSREKVAALEKRGAQLVEGALDTPSALASLSDGASAVVSAVQGGPDVIIDGQARLLRAARDASVKRFIPSDYSLDLFKVKPDVLDFHGLVRAYESGSGKKLRVERLDSLDDLDTRIDQLLKAEPGNMFAWLPLMYYRSVLNGEGKLDELMNDRYPSIRPTTVREYVAQEGL